MCTRFVYNGDNTVVGLNFDIDLSVWTHRVITEKEPGIGYRLERTKYSLITNYSVLNPEITKPYIVSGDNRFERADEQLKKQNDNFSAADAFRILSSVRQEGLWATRCR